MRLPTFPGSRLFKESHPSKESEREPILSETGLKLEKVCRFCRKYRRGAAAVEFAVVAPLFFLLILGMVEFGRMVMVQQMLTNASREGARIAILDGVTYDEVHTTVTDYLENGSVVGGNVQVEPNPPSSAAYGAPVEVTVSISFDQVSWLPSPMFLGGNVLTATSVMRREVVQ